MYGGEKNIEAIYNIAAIKADKTTIGRLPFELLIKIAASSSDSNTHSPVEADIIAANHINDLSRMPVENINSRKEGNKRDTSSTSTIFFAPITENDNSTPLNPSRCTII